MASYQILYWQDIPSQIKVWDDFDEIKVELPETFVARIDRSAQTQGLAATDDFLREWHWGDEVERDRSAQDVADAVKRELIEASK